MSALEEAIGRVATNVASAGLSLDPNIAAHLAPLEGRILQLESLAPALSFFVTVQGGELQISGSADAPPHVLVTGRGPEIIAWMANPSRTGGVSVEGDAALLMSFAAVLEHFDPDLTEPLSNVLGSDAAQTVLGTAELAVSALRSAAEGVGAAIEQTAASQFVTKADTTALLDVLDDLRLRIDRLAARVDLEESEAPTRADDP